MIIQQFYCHPELVSGSKCSSFFMKKYHVYILTNQRRGTLYIGVTGDIYKRVELHKKKVVKGFTQKYSLDQVVYAEEFNYVHDAISREKQLKRWHRDWKINLIEENNPEWRDLLLSQWGLD